ncbi:hypothetical protein [Maridesulfovibrio bastinii]|uniref:hypothetical protein n=1 Tax=Maridesulfovibrio bastinii TaxID=47157 RepID=UPI00041E78CD|nr:hypothetical protein [Maridesulfovibrio bastinii]
MYYHGFSNINASGNKGWTVYDDQLVSLLFARIINKTASRQESVQDITPDNPELVEEMVNNLFDLCFYINKDVHDC